MLRFLTILSLLLSASYVMADEMPDPRGRWQSGEDLLEFTGKNIKKGRYTVEVNYMGMRVSSRGRWMQLKAGLLAWKITDINIGGAPGDSAMLPKAGDYMFGLFAKEGDKLKLFYEMKGFGSKKAEHHPAADKLTGGKLYTSAPKR